MFNKTMLLVGLVIGMVGLSTPSMAGEVSAMSNPQVQIVDVDNSALTLSLMPQYMFSNDSHDGAYGGMVRFGYDFNNYVGFDLGVGYINTDSVTQNYTTNLVVRYPLGMLTPYLRGGVGYHANSANAVMFPLSVGLSAELPWDGVSVFVEGTQNFVLNGVEDYTTIGIGISKRF